MLNKEKQTKVGYHLSLPITTTFILELLLPVFDLKFSSDFKLLDLSCGYGRYSLMISKRYPNSTVYDIDLDSAEQCQLLVYAWRTASSGLDGNVRFCNSQRCFYDAYVEDGILTEVRRVLKSDRFCSFLWVCYLVFPWIFLVLTARGVVLARATKSGGSGFRLVNVGEMNIDVMQKRIVFQIWFILASCKLNPGTTCKSYQVLWNNKFYSINWPHNFTDIIWKYRSFIYCRKKVPVAQFLHVEPMK